MSKPIRVMMMGLRGFPGVQGGVETHAENLCPLLVEMGCDVTVLVRPFYQHAETGPNWKGVKFVSIWAPKSKGAEAFLHSFLGVLYAAFKRPDVLHIQAIGPAIMTPIARLLGLKVVVTHHSQNYDHQGWGRFARFVLRSGESLGMRFSNARIAISKVLSNIVMHLYQRDSVVIPNGVVSPALPHAITSLDQFGLEPQKYVVLVGRLVAEKRHLDLIAAFNRAALPGWKLVIVGASDHPDAYVLDVLDQAKRSENIVCTGLQTGNALRELYGHAGIFVLPSSHEGLPIALLEALSYGLPVIASDIAANLEVGLDKLHYFPLGDVAMLAQRLKEFSVLPRSPEMIEERRAWVSERFNWKNIAQKTMAVYQGVIAKT
jgi:glycosyltransferase involved in cell wall biosynthesis